MTDSGTVRVAVTVDGRVVEADIEPRALLVDFLRDTGGAMAVHIGCGEGTCGACTVSLDGTPVRTCLMLAVQADRAAIITAAGLSALDGAADSENLTRLQRAFRAHHALQCGFCTPGILVATALFLRANPHPTRAEIVDHLSGHLCRCTGYVPIIAAIEAAAGAGP